MPGSSILSLSNIRSLLLYVSVLAPLSPSVPYLGLLCQVFILTTYNLSFYNLLFGTPFLLPCGHTISLPSLFSRLARVSRTSCISTLSTFLYLWILGFDVLIQCPCSLLSNIESITEQGRAMFPSNLTLFYPSRPADAWIGVLEDRFLLEQKCKC